MSRCFPFPAPGYGAHGDALIKSIKLREEMMKAEKERKEKKREKKEKKREKKEKKQRKKEEKERKLNQGTTTSRGTDDGKKCKLVQEIKQTKADGKLQKAADCENEHLERSGITEELDQPCCLSDSTQSSKRKRSSPQTNFDHGPAIKIRLPLRKHGEPEESKSKFKFQVGSSGTVGGNTETFNKITFGSDTQSQGVVNTEPKQILTNSDSRHFKVLQNSVCGDAVVTNTSRGSDHHKHTDPKRVLGKSDSRHVRVMQDLVQGDAVVTKIALGSDRQLKCLMNTEPKLVLGNSDFRHDKVMQNSVRGDAVVSKTTLGTVNQLQCPKNTDPKRALVNTVSRHCKAIQNFAHVEAVVTDNAVDVAMDLDNAIEDGIEKVEFLCKSLLQIPPLTCDGLDYLDQDWLFSSELAEARPVSKKQKSDSDVFHLSTSVWPRAQYLPEVEVYALPFAVPF